MEQAARATCDFYSRTHSPTACPYWDRASPGLAQLGDWRSRARRPYNEHEPVDSSAAAIVPRRVCCASARLKDDRYEVGLKVVDTRSGSPYLSRIRSIRIAFAFGLSSLMAGTRFRRGRKCARGRPRCGEITMPREVALYVLRIAGAGRIGNFCLRGPLFLEHFAQLGSVSVCLRAGFEGLAACRPRRPLRSMSWAGVVGPVFPG